MTEMMGSLQSKTARESNQKKIHTISIDPTTATAAALINTEIPCAVIVSDSPTVRQSILQSYIMTVKGERGRDASD
jgi:hypothetical protein